MSAAPVAAAADTSSTPLLATQRRPAPIISSSSDSQQQHPLPALTASLTVPPVASTSTDLLRAPSDQLSISPSSAPHIYKLYGSRWWVLAVFTLISFNQTVIWISFS